MTIGLSKSEQVGDLIETINQYVADLIYINNRKHLARKYVSSWDKKISRSVYFCVVRKHENSKKMQVIKI